MSKTPESHTSIDMLPWLVNRSRPEAEQQAAEDGVQHQPDRIPDLQQAWQQVRLAALSQSELNPPAGVRQRVLAQAHYPVRPRWVSPLSGLITALLALILLRQVVQPGIDLRWSVNTTTSTPFLVYRASPDDNNHFEVVSEVPARPGALDYTFVDTTLLPDQTYHYRVETANHEAASPTIAVNSSNVLLMQIAIVVSSLLIGLAAAFTLSQWRMPRFQF